MGATCLIAVIVILPTDPAGSEGATGIASFFRLAGWYLFAESGVRRCRCRSVA